MGVPPLADGNTDWHRLLAGATGNIFFNKNMGRLGDSVKRPTLGFGSGHNPGVVGSSPMLGSVLSMEPA